MVITSGTEVPAAVYDSIVRHYNYWMCWACLLESVCLILALLCMTQSIAEKILSISHLLLSIYIVLEMGEQSHMTSDCSSGGGQASAVLCCKWSLFC